MRIRTSHNSFQSSNALSGVGGGAIIGGIIVCDAKDVESNRLAVAIKSVHLKLTHCAPPEAVNAWEVRVTRRSFSGDFVEYRLDWKGQPLLCRGLPDELVEEGETIVCSVAPEHAVLMQSSGTLP